MWVTQEIVFMVHVRPGGRRDRVEGAYGDALAVRVTAPASGGRANAAVCRVLAEAFSVRAGQVEIRSGHGSRRKRIAISGRAGEALGARLAVLLAGRGEDPRGR